GLAAIDALRAKPPRNATGDRPDEILPPAGTAGVDFPRRPDPLELRAAARGKLRARHVGRGRSIDVFDIPSARRDGERAFNSGSIGKGGGQHGLWPGIAIERGEEAAIGSERQRLFSELRRYRSDRNLPTDPTALSEFALKKECGRPCLSGFGRGRRSLDRLHHRRWLRSDGRGGRRNTRAGEPGRSKSPAAFHAWPRARQVEISAVA